MISFCSNLFVISIIAAMRWQTAAALPARATVDMNHKIAATPVSPVPYVAGRDLAQSQNTEEDILTLTVYRWAVSPTSSSQPDATQGSGLSSTLWDTVAVPISVQSGNVLSILYGLSIATSIFVALIFIILLCLCVVMRFYLQRCFAERDAEEKR